MKKERKHYTPAPSKRRLLMLNQALLGTLVAAAVLGSGRLAAQSIIALQGLSGTTLVAGKTTGFRLFTDASTYAAASRIETAILRSDGSRLANTWSRSQVVSIQNSALGANFLVIVPGRDMPWVGGYTFDARIFDDQSKVLTNYSPVEFQLLPTKDVRLIVTYLFKGANPGAFIPTAGWTTDVQQSMSRLGSMFPVRDGVQSRLNGDLNNGLRYVIGTACDGYVNGYYDCVYKQARAINASAGDHVDVSIEFRPGFYQPCREVVINGVCQTGGNSGRPAPPYSDLRRASCVSGNYFGTGMTAACFAQEIGHNFGLEPAGSPNFQDPADPGHSKTGRITDPFPFDFLQRQSFGIIGDVMNNTQGGSFGGPNAIMFSTFDWEYLRKEFMNLPSTGTTTPAHFTTSVAPSVAGVGKSVYFFARRADGRIFYNRAVLGQAGAGWIEVGGGGRANSAPASGAIGTHVFVAIQGLDGNIYLNQADEGKPFSDWFPMKFKTDVAPAVAAVGNSVFVFAKGLDQRIYLSQAELGHGFSDWFEVQGDGRTDAAPAASAIGKHVYVAVNGLDGDIYLNQADFGKAFGQWFPMNFRTSVSPAVAGVGNSVYFFAQQRSRIFYNRAVLGQAGQGWTEVEGAGQTESAPAAGAVGTHVFIAIKGLDNRVYINQADLAKPFGQWFP